MGIMKPYYLVELSKYFQAQIDKNSKYSLRKLSYELNIDPSHLSKILSRKTVPSLITADKIISIITPNNPHRRKVFLESVIDEAKCRALDEHAPKLSDCDKDES